MLLLLVVAACGGSVSPGTGTSSSSSSGSSSSSSGTSSSGSSSSSGSGAAVPSVPTGLASSSIATGSVALTWTASTDPGGSGVGGYYVYRNGTQIATVTSGTSYTDTPLAASTTYSYQVAAFDKATPPHVSALSSALNVTTLADTQAPTVPTGLAASNVTSSTVPLSWNASTDLPNPGGTGVGGYDVYRNGTQVMTVSSGTSYTDVGRTASTTYSYQVAAFDKATPPNVSARSSALSVTTPSGIPLAITPRHAALTLSQTQQFTTNAPAGLTLSWSVDGVAGGNSTVGTISSGGLYTPPVSAGTHSVSAVSPTSPSVTGSAAVAVTDLTGITTFHNDVARTGQNLQEYALTPTLVSGGTFGKRWSCSLDGAVYAQPLYVANLSIGGGTHNVLFVATMHDSVYAFDADNPGCVIYWQDSFINPGAGITTLGSNLYPGCTDVTLEYGITGTPVIDPVAQTIYLVAATSDNGTPHQRLHALDLAAGTERANSPSDIQASVSGTGDGSLSVTFNPLNQNQRLGLALTGGTPEGVIIGWSSHCDDAALPWHGWIMRYDATSLAQSIAFTDTPNGTHGGIWMSAGAPALDSEGNMFLSTGNGSFDATSSTLTPPAPSNDYGESFINLSPTTLAVQDFYTPSHNVSWTTNDLDLSSGGITVLPDRAGPPGHLNVLVGSDKQSHLWMIDRSNMSGYTPNQDNTVQYLTLPNSTACINTVPAECVYATPAFWNGTIYIAVELGPLMALKLLNGLFQFSGQFAIAASQSAETYSFPSPTPMISASPSGGAIVWVLNNNANGTNPSDGNRPPGPAILRGYDATNLATTLYSSATLAADVGGNAVKFTVPVVANGHVYVAGAGALTVYGLAP